MAYTGRHRSTESTPEDTTPEPCTHPGVFSLFTDTAEYVHCGMCNTLVPRHLL